MATVGAGAEAGRGGYQVGKEGRGGGGARGEAGGSGGQAGDHSHVTPPIQYNSVCNMAGCLKVNLLSARASFTGSIQSN